MITINFKYYFFILIILLTAASCKDTTSPKTTEHKKEVISLKNTFEKDFLIGAALNGGQIAGTEKEALSVIEREYNTITSENIMKWMYIHPEPDSFYFEMADKYVALGQKNNMHIVGHALLWHSQIANYMNEVKDSLEMAQYIENHINTIAGRYKGKIDTWDVLNEALNEDGSYRTSNFYNVMGESYIELAFKLAAAADPKADLIYNDYNLWKPEKRKGVIRLIKNLQAKGIKIDGVGMQAHYSLVGPEIEDIENSIIAYAELGMKVMMTELDVTALPNPWDLEGAAVEDNYERYEGDPVMNPFPTSFPDSMQVKLANRYTDLFGLYLKHQDKITRVTFWGVNDGYSWLNNWPIKKRTNYPLFFDRNFKPKPVYDKVIALKKEKK